ncbi:MAG TPA: hypothetical protein VLR26_04010 [Frankiaceae bacterium]|nr:hypothetical protein [Frankiaceae bacterium]
MFPYSSLQICRRNQVDPAPEDSFELVADSSEADQTYASRQVNQQVKIAIGAIVAASDACEKPPR